MNGPNGHVWHYEYRDGEFIVSKEPEYTITYRFTVDIPIRVSADCYADAREDAKLIAESIRKDGFHVSCFDSAHVVSTPAQEIVAPKDFALWAMEPQDLDDEGYTDRDAERDMSRIEHIKALLEPVDSYQPRLDDEPEARECDDCDSPDGAVWDQSDGRAVCGMCREQS